MRPCPHRSALTVPAAFPGTSAVSRTVANPSEAAPGGSRTELRVPELRADLRCDDSERSNRRGPGADSDPPD
jgi:hypothetical protein